MHFAKILAFVFLGEFVCSSFARIPFSFRVNNRWINQTLAQISDLQPNQVTFFIFTTCDWYNTFTMNSLIGGVAQFSMVSIIQVNSINNTQDDKFLKMPLVKNPDEHSLFVVISEISSKMSANFQKVFHVFDVLFPTIVRPKLLTITIGLKFQHHFDFYKRILLRAWIYHRFLDFTILSINRARVYLMSYDPFSNKQKLIVFKNFEGKIFPNKFVTLKKYNLRQETYHINKKVFPGRASADIYIHKYFSYGNLSVYFRIGNEVGTARMNDLIRLFTYDDLMECRGFRTMIYTRVNDYGEIGILLPILHEDNLELTMSSQIFLVFFVFFLSIFIYYGIAKLFQFPDCDWSLINIYMILLGMGEQLPFKKMAEKCIYLSIVVLSITFVGDIIMTITELQFRNTEIPFDTLDSIDKADFKIYADRGYFRWPNSDVPVILRLKEKTNFVNSKTFFEECMQKFGQNDRACISNVDNLEIFSSYLKFESGQDVGPKNYKFSEALHEMFFTVFAYPANFFLLNEINRGMEIGFQTGLLMNNIILRDFFRQVTRFEYYQFEVGDLESGLSYIQLVLILVVGLGLSTLVFLCEIKKHVIENQENFAISTLLFKNYFISNPKQ